MSRGFPVEITDESKKPVVYPVILIALEFSPPTNTLYFHTGLGDTQFGGNTYLGVGQLLTVSSITETANNSAQGMTFVLDGLDPSFVALAVLENYQNRRAFVFWNYLDSTTGLLKSQSPNTQIFLGTMDIMKHTFGQDSASILLTVESIEIEWAKTNLRLYDDEEQQDRHPGDRLFQFAPDAAERQISWPASAKASKEGAVNVINQRRENDIPFLPPDTELGPDQTVGIEEGVRPRGE